MASRIWTAVGLGAACCLALALCPQPASAQGDPPPEADAQQPADPLLAIEVPRSTDSAALALRTTERINELYYSLVAAGAPGFVATFAIQEDGQPAGELRVSWNRARDWVTAVWDREIDQVARDAFEDKIIRGLRLSLCTSWEAEHCYAMEDGDRYILDPTEGEESRRNEEVLHLDFISLDLCSWHHVIRERSGRELEETCELTEVQEKGYLASATRTERLPNRPARKLAFSYKYVRRDGFVFVKRMGVQEQVEDERRSWQVELRDVEFRALQEEAPQGEERTFADEVIEKIVEGHYSLWDTDIAGFEALFAVSWETRSMGKLRLRWQRETGELKGSFEGTPPEDVARAFRQANQTSFGEWAAYESVDWLWDAVLLGFGTAGASKTSQAVRDGERIVLLQKDNTGIADLESMITLLDPEFRVLSVERRFRSGACILRQYDQRQHEGKYLKKKASWTFRGEDATQWNRTVSYVYKRQEGKLFPKRIRAHDEVRTAGEEGADLTLELESLSFQ